MPMMPFPGPLMFFGPLMFLGPLIGLGMSIFWVVLLIDCLRNPRLSGRAKLGWVLLLFFINWIGMLLYFLLDCSFSPIAQKRRGAKAPSWPPGARSSQTYRPYQQPYQPLYPSVPPVTPSSYQPYQEGYQAQAQNRPKMMQFVQDLPTQEETNYESQYEQPQATYPLMPPQEQ